MSLDFFRNDLMLSYTLTNVITLYVFENIFSHEFPPKKHNNFFNYLMCSDEMVQSIVLR